MSQALAESDFPVSEYKFQNPSCRIRPMSFRVRLSPDSPGSLSLCCDLGVLPPPDDLVSSGDLGVRIGACSIQWEARRARERRAPFALAGPFLGHTYHIFSS